MDLFTFAISLMIMLMAFQYNYIWLAVLIGVIIMFMGKQKSIFIIVLILLILLFFINKTPYSKYGIVLVGFGIGIYLFMNRKENDGSDTYSPEDQYGDLLKGLGGSGGM